MGETLQIVAQEQKSRLLHLTPTLSAPKNGTHYVPAYSASVNKKCCRSFIYLELEAAVILKIQLTWQGDLVPSEFYGNGTACCLRSLKDNPYLDVEVLQPRLAT